MTLLPAPHIGAAASPHADADWCRVDGCAAPADVLPTFIPGTLHSRPGGETVITWEALVTADQPEERGILGVVARDPTWAPDRPLLAGSAKADLAADAKDGGDERSCCR
jgi:hypothetical protein